MSGEKKMWDYLRPKLKPYGHFERIESHETALGTPDVEYCIEGYTNRLELKYTERENRTILRPAQSRWFRDRVKAKGQPWLLLHAKVEKVHGYALIPGVHVPELVHTKDAKQWLKAAIAVWADKIDISELIHFLGTYLVVESPESGSTNGDDSSGLILPSRDLIT